MSQPNGLERFSSRNFLLERSLLAARQLLVEMLKNTRGFAIRVCIFGGLLGVMWTLANLRPQGDLAQYLTPFLLLSFPVILLAPQAKAWQRLTNWFVISCFWGVWTWAAIWYFRFPSYQFSWLFLAMLLLTGLTLTTFQKHRNRRKKAAITQTLQLVLWIIGLAAILILLGFLAYFISNQLAPEPSTANILAGGTFLFFLALTIVRVFLLDSMRYRRADRMEHVQPDDAFLFLEWLIPRSYSFLVVLGLLLVAEAMMFSTIYHTFRRPTARVYAPLRAVTWSSGTTGKSTSLWMASNQGILLRSRRSRDLRPLAAVKARPRSSKATTRSVQGKKAGVHRTVGLMEWVLFAFKPYVFPKHEGREVDAPQWFKYLGRALLGLIFAILLTQQLTIWKQFYNLYLTLVGVVRREKHEGENPILTRQKEESLAHMQSMLDIHASPWRRQIFYACTVPSTWIGWMLILDPSTAFWEALGRAQRAIVERWDVALLSTGVLLVGVCAPFAYLYKMGWTPLLYAAMPTLGFGVVLFLLRTLLSLRPPKLYQFWIWWLLLVHLVFSLVLFFLTLSLGKQTGFWHYMLWYTSLAAIAVFPAVYIFGGERHRRVSSLGERVSVTEDDSDVVVRRLILSTFFNNQHRSWLVSALTSRIHPVRGSGIKMRLILPSLIIGSMDAIRVGVEKLEAFIKRTLSSLARSLFLWMAIQVGVLFVVFLTHLISQRQFFSSEMLQSYTITLFCLVGPGLLTAVVMLVVWLLKKKQGVAFGEEIHPRLFLSLMSGLSVVSAMTWMLTHRPFDYWQWFSYSILAFAACSPWVGLISIRYRLQKRRQKEVEDDNGSAFKERTFNGLERLAFWLEMAETNFLHSLYRRATSWRRTEISMRDTMIRGCAAMLEETHKALISGSWYDEEEHAIKRVYLQWLTDELVGSHEEKELAEELAYLTEQVLDTLSSLIYDLEETRRFQQVDNPPELDLLLDTLERVLRLPRSFGSHSPKEWQFQERLSNCLESIHALMVRLHRKWEVRGEKPHLHIKTFRILGLLELDRSRDFLLQQLDKEEGESLVGLLKAFGLSSSHQELLETLQGRFEEGTEAHKAVMEALLCHRFPSPLAFLYRGYRVFRKRYWEQVATLSSMEVPSREEEGLLGQLQTPDILCEARLRLAAEQRERLLREHHCQHLRTTYFNLFGYLFVALKDQWNLSPVEVQELGWETPSALVRSLARLHTLTVPAGPAQDIKELLQLLYEPDHAQFLENSCQVGKNVESCEAILENTYQKALEWIEKFPVVSWRVPYMGKDSNGEEPASEEVNMEFEVLFQGAQPRIRLRTEEEESSLPDGLELGRSLRLVGSQPRPHLEFYISLWFLKLLHELANSDGLLQAEIADARDDNVPSRHHRLTEVEALTARFGRLITPYSSEQQRVLERLFDSIGKRLTLLRNLTMEELDSVEGKGLVDFDSTLKKLTKFLDDLEAGAHSKLTNLLYLNMLPSRQFLYLLKAQETEQGELRWYHNPLTQMTLVQLFGGTQNSPLHSNLAMPTANLMSFQPSNIDLPQIHHEELFAYDS